MRIVTVGMDRWARPSACRNAPCARRERACFDRWPGVGVKNRRGDRRIFAMNAWGSAPGRSQPLRQDAAISAMSSECVHWLSPVDMPTRNDRGRGLDPFDLPEADRHRPGIRAQTIKPQPLTSPRAYRQSRNSMPPSQSFRKGVWGKPLSRKAFPTPCCRRRSIRRRQAS